MNCRPSFPYTPLRSGYIRLFRVNTSISGPDSGFLEVVSLEQTPPFYALSHSWGTGVRDETIQVDGHVLYVTPDLASGIKRLQELTVEGCGLSPPIKHIWIDNLCIHQQDTPERSSQVVLMKDIYSRSIRTLVWLGLEKSSSQAAWDLVDQIYHIFESRHPDAKALVDIPTTAYSDMFHAASGLPAWDHQLWGSLKQLMEYSWFSRIWVVQEVVLSRQDPVIVHNQRIYPWHRFEWAVAWLRRNGYMRLSQVPETLQNVNTMFNLRQAQVHWPLDALMSITQIKFHATDQRDKVFGLLGLAAECQQQLPDALRPDYTVDVAQTYRKVSRFLLGRTSSIALLTRAYGTSGSLTRRNRESQLSDLSSWTPDWSDFRVFNRGLRTSLSWIHYTDPKERPHLGFPRHFNASAGRGLKLYDTNDSSVLRVGGIRVAEVTQVVSFNGKDVSKGDFKPLLDSKIESIWQAATSVLNEPDVVPWAAQLIKVTTAEQHGLTGRVWEQGFKDGLAYLLRLIEDERSQVQLPLADDETNKGLALLRHHSLGGDPGEYAVLAGTYCFNRCFLVTSTGNMGIGPSDTQVGDTISVILGGGVPSVLRRSGTRWVFVGESYVEGFMSGEATQVCPDNGTGEEIFSIM
ncbi:HET domain-containing protein [Dactylonectria estremocensis]|uniref:HET domain-containing protein n=1 Tax=Dactylonectria estremocensis TaxID=1079267 RepID=A0A9P9DUU2_9HYPO|nr:HET domain-containing protein [Dactylonectria estremocensis]